MSIKRPSVAVAILSWNDWKNTTECLQSIFKSDYKNFDIIVIDNNSNKEHFEKLLEWCKEKKIPINNFSDKLKNNKIKKNLFICRITEVADIPFAKNVGVTRSYNKAINFSLKNNYDFFLKLDCDFLVTKNFISGMVKTLQDNKEAVSVSPKVYYYINKKTKLIWWKGLNFTKNYFRFRRVGIGGDRRTLDMGQFKGLITTDSICGCCTMFKSKILKKTKKNYPPRKTILDEDFFFGPEDMEISHRLKKYGKLLVNLDYYTYHKVSQSIYVSGVRARIYHETIGWLLITRKISNIGDTIICHIYFALLAFMHFLKFFYKKNKEPHIGFLLGMKDYFFKY